MNRLQEWLRSLGPTGVVGIGVLVFCVPFYLSAVRPAEQELAAQRAIAERLRARTPFQPVASEGRAEELRRFYSLFPPVERLPDTLEQIYALARAAKLELQQGEYRLEKPPVGLIFYRITLPLRGTYPQIREFVGATLKSMPVASLEALRFERKRVGDTRLEAQIRLTVYFRPSPEGEGS